MQPRAKAGVFYLATLLAICGCTTVKVNSGKKAVGLWEEFGAPVYPISAITLRNEDGTFQRKSIKVFDYAKRAIEFSSTGYWKVSGNRYWEKLTSISVPMWKDEVGREVELEMLELSEGVFRYVSSDGATVVERKIGEASFAEFEAAELKRLPREN